MKITKTQWHGYEAVQMEAGDYSALMIPSMGANMISLTNSRKGVDILRTPLPEDLEAFALRPQLFGLPLLFPPNRIEDGTYTYNGVKYQFPITIPAQNNYHHGIIKSQKFVVTMTNVAADYVEVEASFFSNEINNEIFADFPHKFECRMYFKLSSAGLEHRVTFVNHGATPMPLGVGYHTPIMVPFVKGSRAEDCTMLLSVDQKWEVTERTLPTGKLLPLSPEEAAMRTTGIHPTGKAMEIPMTAKPLTVDGREYNGAIFADAKTGLKLYYEVDKEYKHWTFWNNGGTVNWACAEPQTWAINAPNLGLPDDVTGFQTVAPGKTWSAGSRIYVK